MARSRHVPRLQAALPRLPAAAMRDGTAGRILGAALVLFARRGFHGTSIRDIGDELGLKPANLYAYFESKEHLLAELVRVGHEEHHAALRSALIAAGAGPVEQLQALVRAHVRMHAEYPLLATVANAEMHVLSPELVAPARVLRAQSEALFGAPRPTRPAVDLSEPLSPREMQVLRMLAEGLGNKEIAWQLGISDHTVKFHVASILGKLHASTRTEAVALGIRQGLVPI